MLALLIGLLTSAGLVLRGSWDLWAQSLLFLVVVAGTASWLLARVAVGYVPLPSFRLLAWVAALAALAGFSAWCSPTSYYAVSQWRVWLLGLWVFAAMAAVSKDHRVWVDQGIRAAGWFLLMLAFYQHFRDGVERPASALLNQNVFAGAILLLLPSAAQQRDWLLCSGLLLCLCWTRSVGAWMGLAAALVLTRKGRESVGNYLGMTILFVCLVLIYGKLQSAEVLDRWYWWRAAWRMSWQRPLLGFGPGTYAYVAPSYAGTLNLSTLYAHQHFLETAAELGWPFLIIWIAGLASFLRRGAPHKRFGALALLVQSLWDYPLSIPGCFWLFCCFAASTTTQSSLGVNVPHSRKASATVLICMLAVLAGWGAAKSWRADRLKSDAVEGFKDGKPANDVIAGLTQSLAIEPDPEAERDLAQVLLAGSPTPSEQTTREAIEHLERSARLNPFRPSTWTMLESLYSSLGDVSRAAAARQEGIRYCPALSAAPAS